MTDVLRRYGVEEPPAARASRDVGAALAALSPVEMLRLRAIARLRARALPGDLAWSDLRLPGDARPA